jgi:hypothetical protein
MIWGDFKELRKSNENAKRSEPSSSSWRKKKKRGGGGGERESERDAEPGGDWFQLI